MYISNMNETTKLTIEVGKTYVLNTGHEVTITRKATDRVKFPFYSTPFMPDTHCSAFDEDGVNYIFRTVKIISEKE